MFQILKLLSFGLGFLSFFIVPIKTTKYILVPKSGYLTAFNYQYFNSEHDVKTLAKVGDLEVYSVSAENYNSFTSTFNDLFEIEIDQQYKVVPVPVESGNRVWIQNPGQLHFQMMDNSQSVGEFPWHLDRISKRNLPLNGSYPYWKSGTCHRNNNITIHTYIVDTGVDVDHSEFGGTIEFLENFTDDDIPRDCNSHGTFCSSVIGGKTYGVCKDAKMFGVKVLDCEGSGSTSGVIAGMNYVYNKHLELSKKDPRVRSIMSMSLGGGYSAIMNRVVEKMVTESDTFYVVVAAGNENNDACNTSPASAKGIFSVMASDRNDKRAYFSNWGMCSQLYAPGVNVEGAVLNDKTAVMSGTSFSAPNVAGVMNHYLDQFPYLNMAGLMKKMLKDASMDKISKNYRNTPNLLLYINREDF